jgi:RND family efflux transporter MFP subunit
VKILCNIFFILLCIAAALGGAWYFYTHKPQTRRAEPQRPVPVVSSIEVQARNEVVEFEASGTVIPARVAILRNEVEGQIIEQNPQLLPGGIVQRNDMLIRIDPQDYQLHVRERQAEVVSAQFELEVEQGRQAVARQEWQVLGTEIAGAKVNLDLALRKPHLQHAKARLEAAESRLAAAKLAEQRTKVRAPFTGIILEKNVEQGQFIARQTALATVVATDVFWVQVSVPLSLLDRLQFPDDKGNQGSTVHILMDKGGASQPLVREGRVFKLLADLDPKGRMARLLVRVEDPLNLSKQQASHKDSILLGSFVRIRIHAGQLEEVYVIPEKALREANRLWFINDENRLVIRQAQVLWRRLDEVLVAVDREPDERLIISRLQSPLPGILLRDESSPQPPKEHSLSKD